MTCAICDTDFYVGIGADPDDACDCGRCLDRRDEIDPEWRALMRAVWAAEQHNLPVCENFADDNCSTPLDNVQDYNAETPLREKRYLCDNCTQNECEAANERAQGDAWSGGFADNH